MSVLWKFCRSLFEKENRQRSMFLLLNMVLWGAAGLLVWLVVRHWALNSADWAAVFGGFPACFIGLFGGLIYLFRV